MPNIYSFQLLSVAFLYLVKPKAATRNIHVPACRLNGSKAMYLFVAM